MVPYITSIVQLAKRALSKRASNRTIGRSQGHSQGRSLRLETLEQRALLAGDMAEVTGLILNDLQGDNDPSNDAAASGVAVALYRDGGNGQFDNGGGDDVVAAPSDITDVDGRYSFAGVGVGTYFVKINPGSERQTREGGDVRKVTISAAEAEGVIGRTIDGFETEQSASASPPLPSSTPSSLSDPNVLGGQRDLYVELTDGDDRFTRVALQSGDGLLRLASDPDVTGNARVIWDGADSDAANVNPTGLGGLDLSTYEGNTMTGVSLTVGADHADTVVKLKVYTDANNWSEYTTTVPESEGGRATKTAVFQFATSATTTRGNGADLSNVGAIELTFEGVSAVDGQVSVIELVGLTPKRADFTVYDKLSLGDHVWGEILNDGIRTAQEQGIPNVKLNLFEDSNLDGRFTQNVDKLMGMEFTDGEGDYLFTDLFPGKYLVQVDPSNFVGSGSLAGLSSSTGNGTAPDPDDNVNSDDNGNPLANLGVVSGVIMLTSGGEPTNDGDNDPNTNLTVDFGFFGFDLVLDKSVDEQVAVPGEQLNFEIVITNSGPSTAQDVTFTDTLPANVEFVSGTVSTGAQLRQNSLGNLTANLGDMASGATITVNVLANVPQGVSGNVKNIAEVTARDEVDTSNNMDMVTIPIEPQIDLQIVKSDSDDPVVQGDTFSYTLVGTNNGPSDATGVIVTDILPAGVSFVSATPVQSTVSGNEILFNVGDLASGASTSITILVKVDDDATGTLLNKSRIAGNEKETRLDNNYDEEPTRLLEREIDLQITKGDSDDPVVQGDTFSYTLIGKNNGPFAATGVIITDILPAGVSFVSATPVQSSVSGNEIVFNVGDLAVGESTSVTITVKVDDDASGTLLNVARIVGNEKETRLDNNRDEEPTRVIIREIDLAITKVDRDDPVAPGGIINYELVVTNNGPFDATGVVVSDILPDNVAFQSATPVQTSLVNGELRFEIGDLAVGQSRTIRVNVQVDKNFTGTLFNEAIVEGNEQETRTDNNRDEERTQVVLEPASISGAVFVDRNDNGRLESGEQRIPDVLVTLIGRDFRGNNVEISQRTARDGTYAFTDLLPGTYRVVESQPSTYNGRQLFDGKDELGENGDGVRTSLDGFKAPDSNANDDRDSDVFEGIVLGAGNDGTEYNFGELVHGLSKQDFIHDAIFTF